MPTAICSRQVVPMTTPDHLGISDEPSMGVGTPNTTLSSHTRKSPSIV